MPMSIDPLKKRKIAVLGSRSVGKSSLVKQFVDQSFQDTYHPTIESSYSKNVSYNGVEYECLIIDTAGQDEFTPISSQYTIGIHGFVLVYSITSRRSFDMIPIVYDKIVEFSGTLKVPCVVVGSKCDLSAQRAVDSKNLETVAGGLGCAWIETSAKDNTNVAKVFELCLQEIEKNASPNLEVPTSKCVVL